MQSGPPLVLTVHQTAASRLNKDADRLCFCETGSVRAFLLLLTKWRMISRLYKPTHPDVTSERHLIMLWLRNMYQSLPSMKADLESSDSR